MISMQSENVGVASARVAPTVCFFLRTADPKHIQMIEAFRNDFDTLCSFGFQVEPITRVRDLRRSLHNFYFVWWFGYGFFAVLWARLRRRPCVLIGNVHTEDGRGLEGWPLYKRILMKSALRLATATIFTSRTEMARIGRARANNPHVLYHSVDLDRHRPREVTHSPTIVAISQLTIENVRRKMVLESLDAFAMFLRDHPGHRFVLIGDHGSGLAAVERRIAELQLQDAVELPGRVTAERKLDILQGAEAYFQPSRSEGFGMAILEAEACGCPVVTSREPCIVEVNGDAVLYGDDASDWAGQLARLADDARLWQEMRARGLANAARFSNVTRREKLRAILVGAGFPDRDAFGAGSMAAPG